MSTVYDVPADVLINHVAEELKRMITLVHLNGLTLLKLVFTKKESQKIETGGL